MSAPWKKLLWLVDLGASSEPALRQLRNLIAVNAVELHVLHVVPPKLTQGVADLIPEETWRRDEACTPDAAIKAQLARFAEAHRLGPATVLAMRRGRPAEEAMRYAEEYAIDLIVVLRPSRTIDPLFTFSGISSRLAIRAPCSVLVLTGTEDRNET